MLEKPGVLLADESRHPTAAHVLVLVTAVAVPGHSRDDSRLNIHFPDAMVHGVGDVHVISAVEDDSLRGMQHGLGRKLAIVVKPEEADTGDGRDDARRRVDLPDAVAAFIDDVDIAGTVHRKPHDIVQPGLRGRTAIVQIERQVEPTIARGSEPAFVIAEVNTNGVARQHHQVFGYQRLLPRIVFGCPASRDRRHHPCLRIISTNTMRLGVGNIERVVVVEGDGSRIREIDL